MSNHIKSHIVLQIKDAPFGLFANQLNESTLKVFVKYVCDGAFKREFLSCSSLETNIKAADIFGKVSSFFESENLEWKNLAGCCTDGAPAMLGCNSGFQAFMK